MLPRLRRLHADFDKVRTVFAGHPHVQIVAAEGDPPERYEFEIAVDGLVEDADGKLTGSQRHRVEVMLPLEYPRRPPFCRMLSPVFHPNIDPSKICIGDHWSAGQSLAHLVVRIVEMICYQSYNVKSPLNARAAAWAQQHENRLPLVKSDVSGGL